MSRPDLHPEKIGGEILRILRQKADPQKAKGVQRYFKEPVKAFGLSAAESHGLAKEFYSKVKDDWHAPEAVALCDLLLPQPELECKGIASLILARFAQEFPAWLLSRVEKWLEANYLDNWASVDVLCPEVVSPLLIKYPELIPKIQKWAASPNRWVRRASIVSFIRLAKKPECQSVIYKIIQSHLGSQDDLIQKASGWLLREAGKQGSDRLEKFLLKHGPKIPRTTLRYAIERFPESKRKNLLRATLKPKETLKGQ